MLRISFLILVLISPFVLLIGVHPGIGRRYLMRWLEVTIGVLIKEVFLTFALMLTGMLYVMVFASPLPWGGQMLVLSMIAIAVLWHRKRLVSIAGTTVNTVTPHRVIARVGGQQNEQRAQASSGASGPQEGRSGGPRALTRQGGPGNGARRGRLRLRKASREQGTGASGNTSSSRAPAASGDAETSGHGNTDTSPRGGEQARASSSGDRRDSSGGDPGGSGRARSPRAAPALRRSDQPASSSGGDTDGKQPEQRASREEHQPRERGSTWGDVQQAHQGQQRRRDWGNRNDRGGR